MVKITQLGLKLEFKQCKSGPNQIWIEIWFESTHIEWICISLARIGLGFGLALYNLTEPTQA